MSTIRSEDDSSSSYSVKSRTSQELPSIGQLYGKLLQPMPDPPSPNDVDHQIGNMGGSTMALEISPVRVQMTKMRGLPGDPEQFLEDQLTCHKWENDYFETCHEIYQELLLSTLSISSQIISQSQTCMLQRMWMPEDEPMSKDFMRVAAEEFNEAFRHSYEKEAKAKQIWIDKWRRKKESDFLMPWL